MPFRGQAASRTFGRGGDSGGIKAQCRAYWPPCSTHRRRISSSAAVSRLPVFLGGMRSVGSSWVTRAISSLESGSPGTIAASPLLSVLRADSRTSSRKPLASLASSWPWQAKQFFARIGRTSRLKSTFRGDADAPGSAAEARPRVASRPEAIIAEAR